jgi:hypothetical protein
MEGARAAYRGGVPDKRQTSKQKRASRNRAQREALAARRENASAVARPAVTSSSSSSSKGGGTRAGSGRSAAAAAAAPSGPRPSGLDAFRRENRRPGDVAVMISLVLAIVGFILVLRYQVPTDDRGEAIPVQFGGLALAARGVLTGTEITKGHESILTMYGPGILAMLAIPVVVVAVVLVLNMRMEQRSRVLTIGMVAVAGVVFLTGLFGIYYLAALVFLAIASFQVRKIELPQRQAEMAARREARQARRGGGSGQGAIDVDEVEPEDAVEPEPTDAPVPTERERRPRRSRAARRATTAEAEVVDAQLVEQDDDVAEVDAASAEPAPQAAQTDDDILAELEEELRRESEDDDEDGPTGRTR